MLRVIPEIMAYKVCWNIITTITKHRPETKVRCNDFTFSHDGQPTTFFLYLEWGLTMLWENKWSKSINVVYEN